MVLTRRDFLIRSSAVYSALLLQGCGDTPMFGGGGSPQGSIPADPALGLSGEALPAMDPLAHLLRRTRFATRREDYADAQQAGADAYLENQLLAPSPLDPVYVEAALRFPFTLAPPPFDLALAFTIEQATQQLAEKTVFLAAYSPNQLYEVMVDFWTNHFNIENITGELPLRKLYDDTQVTRAHAFGKFGNMLVASAKSPAMLEYLDGVTNLATGPNQNYARELMELHTLGVGGGYTEADVKEVARCFTGWSINGGTRQFEFIPTNHDDGEKIVLGQIIAAGGGVTDGEQVLNMLAAHPSTSRFIARKLVRRFVSDTPPQTLVDRLAQVFGDTTGDIPSLLRVLFTADEFYAAQDQKFKRPLEYVSGILRTLFQDQSAYDGAKVINALSRMGQIPHRWFPPDGYPDRAGYWLNTSGLLERWNLAAESAELPTLTGSSPIAHLVSNELDTPALVASLAASLLQRPLRSEDASLLVELASGGAPAQPLTPETRTAQAGLIAGLLLASPYFTLR